MVERRCRSAGGEEEEDLLGVVEPQLVYLNCLQGRGCGVGGSEGRRKVERHGAALARFYVLYV